jgi:uncharacterized lipoprotein YmbA
MKQTMIAPGTRLLLVASLFVFLLNACIARPKASMIYALQPVTQERVGQRFVDFNEMILLMPVRLAPQLQGRGLILQRSASEYQSSANHLWAGPLNQQIADTIVGNLKNLLGTDNIAVFPGPRFGITRYQVEVEINEFSGDKQSFTTRGVYTLSDTTDRTIVRRKSFQHVRAIDKPDYSSYVNTASLAIGDLSKEVAAALLAASQSQSLPLRPHEQ